ncbi:AfsR/SARP family transcriptional regulator [Solwaraspora sp. WMMB335]|uniref:AfsR/SARP family transcriptional regulator n=1 Tax=Solwaraspora sp. WMMB335 TaxID=3404118 RepID=UPI003B940B62
MEFVILGPTSLSINKAEIALGPTRQRALLAVLLYRAGNIVRPHDIVEYLWPDESVESRRRGLHELVSRVRAVLRGAGLDGVLPRVSGAGGYRLDIDPDVIDYHRFRRLVRQARAAAGGQQHDQAISLLDSAVALWRDEPLADLRSARAEHLRRDIHDNYLEAHQLLATSRLMTGQHEKVLRDLEPLIRDNMLREELAAIWVRALLGAGRLGEAKIFSADFHRTYRKTMRLDPAIDLNELIRADRKIVASRSNGTRNERYTNRTAAATPNPVPQQVHPKAAHFTGRENLLALLDEIESGSTVRTVLLAGMPGVGKTALAAHWAHLRRDRFPDGQLYLDAEAYGPVSAVAPAEALNRFLIALGVPPARVPIDLQQRRERYQQILHDRKLLVVIDNVRDSEHVRPLLTNAPGCLTIVISRNQLRWLPVFAGVRHLPVRPLTAAEAHVLLDRLTRDAQVRDQPDSLRALAGLSAGLPLALSIIGAYVSDRPGIDIAELAGELATELLDCDADESSDITLRTIFGWSYQALAPDPARLFRLLGLFPGSTISISAASALLGDANVASDSLNALVRANLVNHAKTPRRYGMHDLLRLYAVSLAARHIAAPEQRAALHRILDWYLHSASRAARLLAPGHEPVPDMPPALLTTPQPLTTDTEAMSWITAERPNLGAVVTAAADSGFPRYAWQIAGNVHQALSRSGRQDDVLDLLHTAVAAAAADRHDLGHVGMMLNIAATHFARHDYPRAAAGFVEALHTARRKGIAEGENAGLHNLGSAYLKSGDPARAVALLREAFRASEQSGYLLGQAANLTAMGDAYRALRQFDRAAGCYTDASDRFHQVGELRGEGRIAVRMAVLQLDLGNAAEALDFCTTAIAIYQRSPDDAHHCDALTTAADARRLLGHHAEAEQNVETALSLSEAIGDNYRRVRGLGVLADILVETGRRTDACSRCDEALDLVVDLAQADDEAQALRERLLATMAAVR